MVAERGGVLQKGQPSREKLGLHCLYCNSSCDARFDPNPNSITPCRGLPNHIGQDGYGYRGCRGGYADDGLMGRGKLGPMGVWGRQAAKRIARGIGPTGTRGGPMGNNALPEHHYLGHQDLNHQTLFDGRRPTSTRMGGLLVGVEC